LFIPKQEYELRSLFSPIIFGRFSGTANFEAVKSRLPAAKTDHRYACNVHDDSMQVIMYQLLALEMIQIVEITDTTTSPVYSPIPAATPSHHTTSRVYAAWKLTQKGVRTLAENNAVAPSNSLA
jgi:hypothetical protein